VLGGIPETLQTSHGSLTTGLDLRAGQRMLIRGGTSALGFAAAAVAHELGATVLATTRHPARLDTLAAHGVDHPILDGGSIARQVHRIAPGGVDAALELVGTPTLPDTLAATRIHGTVCFAGMLSDQWAVPDFYPIAYLPTGDRLTAYGGGAADLPSSVLQNYLDRIGDGSLRLGPSHTYLFDQIREAHRAMDTNTVSGKLRGPNRIRILMRAAWHDWRRPAHEVLGHGGLRCSIPANRIKEMLKVCADVIGAQVATRRSAPPKSGSPYQKPEMSPLTILITKGTTNGQVQGRLIPTSARPSVSTAAWVSCSPSRMDSASHGWAPDVAEPGRAVERRQPERLRV